MAQLLPILHLNIYKIWKINSKDLRKSFFRKNMKNNIMNKNTIFTNTSCIKQGGRMEIKEKRILSIICFYTLITLTILMAGGFIVAMAIRTFPLWAKVVYITWAGLVIATVIFDIVCTATNSMKMISGLIIYILTILAIAMSVIVYLVYTTRNGLATDINFVYILAVAMSYATSLFMIAEFITGENLIEHNTSAKSLRQKGIKE